MTLRVESELVSDDRVRITLEGTPVQVREALRDLLRPAIEVVPMPEAPTAPADLALWAERVIRIVDKARKER